MPTPSIGRIVHYQSLGGKDGTFPPEPRAAIITGIPAHVTDESDQPDSGYEQAVHLAVINPTGMYFNQTVPYADTPTPGHWNWPPRVDA
ncbi:hypothetical protein IU501_34670 [Nocardia otitidiscaviarum]|uniref:hypothetical protein n=1 Tax=Nocardia otitidiscaviarum TaxID=1823 RepID=UPI0018935FB0|nr:hypothetical protein [Nocardia otitidiscaviarum]MBF6138115.1 hypothetical protein [Nocardia otitidiscaviarum]